MKPWRFFVLIEPPAIGNVNVVPEAVAGLIGATVIWLSDSSFAAAADAVIVVVPPVIFVCAADATPGSTRANAVIAMARARIRIMELPSWLSKLVRISPVRTHSASQSCDQELRSRPAIASKLDG